MQMYSQIRLEGPILRVIDLDVELAYYQKFGLIPIRRFLGGGGHEMIELVLMLILPWVLKLIIFLS